MNEPGSEKRWYHRTWPHIVAAYALFHVASIVIGSLPAPVDALNRNAWKDPTVQAELTAWAESLNRLGLKTESAELEDTAWRLFNAWVAWTQTASRPFFAYQQVTGTSQAWSMFVAPHRHPSRLHVDIREKGGDWREIYVARSLEATWLRPQLDHVRVRSAVFRYAWPQYNRRYRDLCNWLAARAAHDFPRATHARVQFYKYRTPAPDEVRADRSPKGEFTHSVVVPLDDYR